MAGKKTQLNYINVDWLTLDVASIKRQYCTFDPTSPPQQGICAKWTSCAEINKVSQNFCCTWRIKVAFRADAHLRCSADACCQSCKCFHCVWLMKRNHLSKWKLQRSVHFHIFRLKCQSHIQTSVSSDTWTTAETAEAQLNFRLRRKKEESKETQGSWQLRLTPLSPCCMPHISQVMRSTVMPA